MENKFDRDFSIGKSDFIKIKVVKVLFLKVLAFINFLLSKNKDLVYPENFLYDAEHNQVIIRAKLEALDEFQANFS